MEIQVWTRNPQPDGGYRTTLQIYIPSTNADFKFMKKGEE